MMFRCSLNGALIEEVIQGCLTLLNIKERLRYPFVVYVEC